MLKRVWNPPNPWKEVKIEWLDTPPPPVELEIYEEEAKTIVTENESPDVGFRFSLNPYRGCFHACAYCYARPSHQYWDFGAGSDFERKIIVKINAPEKLRETFMKKSWAGDLIAISGNTDCYQPLEASYKITRRCLEVCREFRNPVGVITKGALIRRDIDVLSALSRQASATVNMSIAFSDDEMARKIDAGAPAPSTRFATIKALSEAGISVGVGIAPIIPGLNDSQVAEILERAHENGATRAFRVMLRLPSEVKPVFFTRIQEAYPDRAAKILHAVQEMRDGALYNSQFHQRGIGKGPRWDAIEWLFDLTCRKLGMNKDKGHDQTVNTFRRPESQLNLFE